MKKPEKASDIRLGRDAHFDAWLYNMMMDNNIAFHMNPDFVASPEQLRFMVALEDDQVYLPCSDAVLQMLIEGEDSKGLLSQYNRVWRIIVRLAYTTCPDKKQRTRALLHCAYRFRQSVRQGTVIPSRLVKRMTGMILSLTDDLDPWTKRRREANLKAEKLLNDPDMQRFLQMPPKNCACASIPELRNNLNFLEISRYMYLSMRARPWVDAPPSRLNMEEEIGFAARRSPLLRSIFSAEAENKTVLFLSDAEGGAVFDIVLLFCVMRMGYRVIYAVKHDFFFYSPTIYDMQTDPVLKKLLLSAHVVRDRDLSKNQLVKLLQERKLLVINDGTRERLNLHHISLSFARAWKEADIIIAKGWRNRHALMGSSHKFTRDILCYWTEPDGSYHMDVKPQAVGVRKFSDIYLVSKAEGILEEMRKAKQVGKTVMFYSCIIGSIPGQTRTAVQVVNAFVGHLREKTEEVFIVNPTEQFEEGMDGDDLMYMWEQVQRSNLIDIWRFQTVEDIETSFALLGRKVPPCWTGKDSTFSTGCTKEMQIAREIQQQNKELQIIGPAPEKFFRRGQYGVGKYFEAGLRN